MKRLLAASLVFVTGISAYAARNDLQSVLNFLLNRTTVDLLTDSFFDYGFSNSHIKIIKNRIEAPSIAFINSARDKNVITYREFNKGAKFIGINADVTDTFEQLKRHLITGNNLKKLVDSKSGLVCSSLLSSLNKHVQMYGVDDAGFDGVTDSNSLAQQKKIALERTLTQVNQVSADLKAWNSKNEFKVKLARLESYSDINQRLDKAYDFGSKIYKNAEDLSALGDKTQMKRIAAVNEYIEKTVKNNLKGAASFSVSNLELEYIKAVFDTHRLKVELAKRVDSDLTLEQRLAIMSEESPYGGTHLNFFERRCLDAIKLANGKTKSCKEVIADWNYAISKVSSKLSNQCK